MRYFFHIGYNGFNYHGWQRHDPHLTIQQILEESISKALKTPLTISGCGRTDTRVHANQYFFHLDVEKKWNPDSSMDGLLFRLNKMLPEDIAIFDILPVDNSSHAQYSAIKRTYDYLIHTYKDPFLNRFSCFYQDRSINPDKMKQAIILLTAYNDYRAFCKSPGKYKHTVCNATSAKLFSDKRGDQLRIQISSNRFLRGMMRALMAQLIKTGTGEISVEEFESYLISKEPNAHIKFAAPQGLYLSQVVYPFLDLPPRTEFFSVFHYPEKLKWQLA